MYVCMYTCMHVCMYVYGYIYTYIYVWNKFEVKIFLVYFNMLASPPNTIECYKQYQQFVIANEQNRVFWKLPTENGSEL